MHIVELSVTKIEIPFKSAFVHASKSRLSTESVLIKIRTENNLIGIGEGCPRSYVTAESLDSVFAFVEQYRESLIKFESLLDLQEFSKKFREQIDQNPAAWCAIELAMLDVMAKEQGSSIESFLTPPSLDNSVKPELTSLFEYTAVLGIMGSAALVKTIERYKALGSASWKVKLSGNLESDQATLGLLAEEYPRPTIRLDANNLWANADIGEAYLSSLPQCFWGVEEPLYTNAHAQLESLSEAINCKIILDESFIRLSDVDKFSNQDWWIPNIRISKMGGILRTIELLEKISGRDFILGAQVGETSILTRAAIVIARKFSERLLAQEGAFGTYLLERDLVKPELKFGLGGRLILPPGGLGFGLSMLDS